MMRLNVQQDPRSGDKTGPQDWPNNPIQRADPKPNPNGPRGPKFAAGASRPASEAAA